MKIQITLTLVLSLFITTLFGQEFKGVATYKTDRKVDLRMDSTSMMDSEMHGQLQAQLRKQFQREYTLNFNANESIYTEVEKLDAPSPAISGGINIVVAGNTDILYRNTAENKIVRETEIMSKPFLIKDVPEKRKWELTKETKSIGEYTCLKATSTEEIEEQIFSSELDSVTTATRLVTTTAWYTLDIPVQHGPDEYWGLPGLILEISDGDQTILCSKIVLNPEKADEIIAPKNGKVVTRDEFREIQDKKMKEMQEQFESSGRRGEDGNRMMIRIGG
ncbi:MAG: GLPGLI family protein [Bacteroidia bacterium]|nr:GLPGLI family protein [Bacteroidia bacterium]NNF29813.1 GLPGLI family protein [Flavobacteriaceae bacterium]MBT8275987.1 GLPGLI family protein [Bacteroidia bacterium]NNJ80815.1 GLPGLI family protein [Flavobacteriaceae bacterium]NNK55355.1 GLPGLI family protein [Flavobacteriaceae bacterium]